MHFAVQFDVDEVGAGLGVVINSGDRACRMQGLDPDVSRKLEWRTPAVKGSLELVGHCARASFFVQVPKICINDTLTFSHNSVHAVSHAPSLSSGRDQPTKSRGLIHEKVRRLRKLA